MDLSTRVVILTLGEDLLTVWCDIPHPHTLTPSHTHRLSIGLGVGIPTIIGIIVLVVLLYCWCVRYQNRKMQVLIESYEREENNSHRTEGTNFVAPPPYTPLRGEEETDLDAELPPYCENDPFTGPTSPNSSEDQERTASPRQSSPQAAATDNDQTVEVELEDVPRPSH